MMHLDDYVMSARVNERDGTGRVRIFYGFFVCSVFGYELNWINKFVYFSYLRLKWVEFRHNRNAVIVFSSFNNFVFVYSSLVCLLTNRRVALLIAH